MYIYLFIRIMDGYWWFTTIITDIALIMASLKFRFLAYTVWKNMFKYFSVYIFFMYNLKSAVIWRQKLNFLKI